MTTGEEAVKQFVSGWEIHPMFSFRQGWRRTWVVRASSAPQQRLVEDQAGDAVLQEYQPRLRPAGVARGKWQPQQRTSKFPTPDSPQLKPKPPAITAQLNSAAPIARPALHAVVAADPVNAIVGPSLEERIALAVAAAFAPSLLRP